jgi:GNAT superfamily N-acetyltransferase
MPGMQTRLATIDDIPELVRLRQVMIESVRGESDDSWQDACAAILERSLRDVSMVAVVVDQPEGPGLAACGVAVVAQRLPGPGCTDGRYGYIQSMCTDGRHRRQGLARLVFEGLMRWYAEAGVTRVDLHASRMGEPLYRQLGFTDPTEPELRWRAG